MTNLTTRVMIAAATLVVAAGGASAQTLKAEIPFTFRASGVVMQAGTYRVNVDKLTGRPMFRLWSANDHRSVILLSGASRDPDKAWTASGNPVLSFECADSHCALAGIWTGNAMPAYTFPRPKAGRDEPTRTALVVMRPDKGD
ncbi:MAG: hypothetical protein LAQ69_02240 [Acidobacteriia bacterium]|nr:hypothetical protein [Terriglobia bacterium]